VIRRGFYSPSSLHSKLGMDRGAIADTAANPVGTSRRATKVLKPLAREECSHLPRPLRVCTRRYAWERRSGVSDSSLSGTRIGDPPEVVEDVDQTLCYFFIAIHPNSFIGSAWPRYMSRDVRLGVFRVRGTPPHFSSTVRLVASQAMKIDLNG
jgi:hypothetical protein